MLYLLLVSRCSVAEAEGRTLALAEVSAASEAELPESVLVKQVHDFLQALCKKLNFYNEQYHLIRYAENDEKLNGC